MKNMKIGETRNFEGKKYRCEFAETECKGCSFIGKCKFTTSYYPLGSCVYGHRLDGKNVIFVEIKKAD